MKVSELKGPLLDYWVARAEWGVYRGTNSETGQPCWVDAFGDEIPCYSTDWDQAGPIIERERIYPSDKHGVSVKPGPRHWCCYKTDTKTGITVAEQWGSTMLEAAMRCYVMSNFGDEVGES
jgi:hypothetical protein